MKPVKLNQLLFSITPPCLSIYVPDAAAFGSLEARLLQRLVTNPQLREIFTQELHSIREVLRRRPDAPFGFYLSPQRRGYLLLDHDTDPSFVLGESFHLRPVLQEIFGNPEYALVVLGDTEMSLYRGDARQVELLERHEYTPGPGPQLVYGLGAMITPSQRRGLKDLAMRIHQSAALANLPVVVAGASELVRQLTRGLSHSAGVVTLNAPHFAQLTCPQLLAEYPRFRDAVVEHHAENFKFRLKGLVKTGRIVSDMNELIRAIGEGKVLRLLLPEKRRLWGKVDFQTGRYEIMGLHEVEGAEDILDDLAEATIRSGGKIQFLPEHFFPHGSHAMVILRGANTHAHSPVFGVASRTW